MVVPDVLRAIQFPGRLLTHVTLLVAALVALGLLAARRLPRSRAIVFAAVAVAAAGSALALHQAWSAQRYGSAGELIESSLHVPATWYAVRDYRLLRPAAVPRPARVLAPSPARVSGDRLVIGSAAPGVYASNVVYSELVRGFGGARVVGRDQDGLAVLEVPAAGAGDAGVEPARPPAVAAARVVSALALVAALATVGGPREACPTGARRAASYRLCPMATRRFQTGGLRRPVPAGGRRDLGGPRRRRHRRDRRGPRRGARARRAALHPRRRGRRGPRLARRQRLPQDLRHRELRA